MPEKLQIKEKGEENYPNGTLLCSHRCVQPNPELGTTSDMADGLLSDIDRVALSPLCFSDSETRGAVLPLCNAGPRCSSFNLPVNSEKPINGLIGDVGEEFKDTTEGG